MEKSLGILHLSDIHASANNQKELARLTELLKHDLDKLTSEHSIDINAICITGDLINSGETADSEMAIVLDTVIDPLITHLGIDSESVFVVSGNHEVNRSAIDDFTEAGLNTLLNSEDAIEKCVSGKGHSFRNRISYFDSYAELFGGTPVFSNEMCHSHIHTVGNHKIGIACVDSAWRSTGVGIVEKGKMLVGAKQIIDSFEAIKDATVRICLMHHPLDWLADFDKNAVEKCIYKFDIILNGHIHELDTKMYTTFNGQTLQNTAGKFDNSSDIYNGYSLLSINPYNKDCRVFLRQYLPSPRDCYDRAIHLETNGEFSAPLGDRNEALVYAYNVVHSIHQNFIEFAKDNLVINVASTDTQSSFEDAFIPPSFSEFSDFEKGAELDLSPKPAAKKETNLSVEELCNKNDNFVLLGRKESGKTTVIHYITKYLLEHFNLCKTVPIIIDCGHADFAGKDVIVRNATKFINEYCDPNSSFSQKEVQTLVESGHCTIIFDSFDSIKGRDRVEKKINQFLKEYQSNRYIFCEKELLSTTEITGMSITPECNFKEYHLCSLSKHQIRTAAQKHLSVHHQADSATLVDKIMSCFKNTSLPKTPFILSLILSLCKNADYSPVNEAVLLEQFMELLLEKNAPSEIASNTYDFRSKEDFLIALVSNMLEKNCFEMSCNEFSDFLSNYHMKRGFDSVETKFSNIFFEKGVLVRSDNTVRFRYNCMAEYYIAKRASQEPDFLSWILEKNNYLHFPNELLYYTGLNRRNVAVLNTLKNSIEGFFDKIGPITSTLDTYQIDIDIMPPEGNLQEKLEQTKLTQEECDEISEFHAPAQDESVKELNTSAEFSRGEAFIGTFFILGTCIKNLEFIDLQSKSAAYDSYLKGLSYFLSMLKLALEAACSKEISEMLSQPDKYTEADIEEFKKNAMDCLKIVLPIAVQNIATDNIGTSKLRAVYESACEKTNATDFDTFFSTFILCDLRVPGVENIIQKYVKRTTNKSLLKIIFFKLLFYYRYRHFPSAMDCTLENILADIQLKTDGQGKLVKSYVIKNLQEDRSSRTNFLST